MVEPESTAIVRTDSERIAELEQRVEQLERQREQGVVEQIELKRDASIIFNWMKVVAQQQGLSKLFEKVERDIVERFGQEFGTLPGPVTLSFSVAPAELVPTHPMNGVVKRRPRLVKKRKRRGR